MLPQDEFRIISNILLPDETYHIKIQKNLEEKDKIKHHKPEIDENDYKDLLEDKILGILGG